MASVSVTLPSYAGGITKIDINVNGNRAGGSDDHCAFRVVRRRSGWGDVVLPGEMYFRMTSLQDSRAMTFIDDSIPADGPWLYQLQVRKITGNGYFGFVQISGTHAKR